MTEKIASYPLPFRGFWVTKCRGFAGRDADTPIICAGGAIVSTVFSREASDLTIAAQLGAHDFCHRHPLY